MRKFWHTAGICIALLVLGGFAALAGCNRSAVEKKVEEEAAGDFAQAPQDESSGWTKAEEDIGADEGLLSPEQEAETGENLPPNLTGKEKPDIGDLADEGKGGGEPANLSGSSDAGFDGAAVYKDFNCDLCHGESRAGSEYGPPLKELTKFWQRPDLEEYLMDPLGYAKTDDRLMGMLSTYKNGMPSWHGSGEEMGALIDWLLLVPEEEKQ